jgi:hypothetical protein
LVIFSEVRVVKDAANKNKSKGFGFVAFIRKEVSPITTCRGRVWRDYQYETMVTGTFMEKGKVMSRGSHEKPR